MAQYGVWQYGSSPAGYGDESSGGEIQRVGHQFTLANMIVVRQPSAKTAWNQFDEFGLLASLQRNDGESNWAYKRRIHDAFTNLANSSYRGLVHGITRELGLALFNPLKINPRVDHNGRFLATDPYIYFDGAYLYLYSDYANNQLDWVIDRFEPGGNYEHLQRLVDFVNTTTFFEAELINSADPYTRSMTIVNQSNRMSVDEEEVQASTKFKLAHPYVVPNSLTFNDTGTFRQKMSSADAVANKGQWHIDYTTGVITVGHVPDPSLTLNYQYSVFPFRPVASPVILHDINNDNFRTKMFTQITQDDGTTAHGAPNELGVDIVNELMSVVPMYWGI